MLKESLKLEFSEMLAFIQNRLQTLKDVEKVKEKFCCPICGGREYEEVTESNGIISPGGHSWTDYYFCSGFTAMFKDPILFTKK